MDMDIVKSTGHENLILVLSLFISIMILYTVSGYFLKKIWNIINLEKLKEFIKSRTPIDIDSPIINILKDDFLKNLIITGSILVSAMILYSISGDNLALSSNTYLYLLLVMLPIGLGMAKYYNLIGGKGSGGMFSMEIKLMAFAMIAFFMCILLYYYSNASTTGLLIFNYIILILFILIVIVGLALLYYVLGNFLKKQTGFIGFIINLIFYIPCMVAEFVNYMREQWKITPNNVFVLFFIEIVLILVYISIPYLTNAIVKNNTNIILKDPVFLSKETTIAGSDTFKLDRKETVGDKEMIKSVNTVYRNNNYALSFWVYVNNGSNADKSYTKESTIFSFSPTYDGNGEIIGGRPVLTYKNTQETPHTFTMYFTNNGTNKSGKYKFNMDLQKWNYVVVNYHDSQADLLVNGIIQYTSKFDNGNIPQSLIMDDVIKVGSNDGISGAICNVNYFKEPLPFAYITSTYNIYKNLNPPIPFM